MEMMKAPTKEELDFVRIVLPWISSHKMISGKHKVYFQDDTPDNILDLFERIKSKLGYC